MRKVTRSVSGFYGLACVVMICLGGCGGGGDNSNDENDNGEDDGTSITTIAEAREELARTNQAPVADLQVFDRVGEGNPVRPTHVDLDASGSSDPDGFVEHYTFQLFDADSGAVLAGPVFTREPFASLRVNRELPGRLRATVTIEDDENEIDTAEMSFGGPELTCSTPNFACSTSAGVTECQLKAAATTFTTAELLSIAQVCDPTIAEETPLRISAWGGGGARGANDWPRNGGAGGLSGLASLGTTLSDLDALYGADASYCYGLGQQGWFGGSTSGLGGASTILRTCANADQTLTTGVLLIAGGGGGGGAGGGGTQAGTSGGNGGIALSNMASSGCPPDEGCKANSTPIGGGGPGGEENGNDNLFPGEGGAQGFGGAGGGGSEAAADGGPGAGGVGGAGGTIFNFEGQPTLGPATWYQGTPGSPLVTGDTGSGGFDQAGGTGGGGYGGGGGGGGISGTAGLQGGGGGGSFAAPSTAAYDSPRVGASLPGSLGFFFTPQRASQN